jgi:hypothetical protein
MRSEKVAPLVRGAGWLGVLFLPSLPLYAQNPEPTSTLSVPVAARAATRRVVMKDSLSAEQFRQKLEEMKRDGLFRQVIPGDPKNPRFTQLSFLASGNYLLVVGDHAWVDAEIDNIRLMAFLYERPRAHLQLNLRVVQLTGPANTDVIQMTETVRALVDTQRAQVVRAFADLQDYLLRRMEHREAAGEPLYDEVRHVLPALGDRSRPPTVPEILLMMLLERALPPLPATEATADTNASSAVEAALQALPRRLARILGPNSAGAAEADVSPSDISPELSAWKAAVRASADWCRHYAENLDRRDGLALGGFRQALLHSGCPLPSWVTLRLRRALEMTERLYPEMSRHHTQQSLRELERRFRFALLRAEKIEQEMGGTKGKTTPERVGAGERNLLALKSVADELTSAPMVLFEAIVSADDGAAPTAEQIRHLFREYGATRQRLDLRLSESVPADGARVNYARLQTLEASLNLWLRRASEAMSRALDQQFYSRYVEQLRLLANKNLGRSSSRDVLALTNIEDVPDIARDLLLADTGVNIFVSNSVSLQFADDATNSVSAEVQGRLPENTGLSERIARAEKAADSLQKLQEQYNLNGESLVNALLAGGQAVPARAGIRLSARPSIAFDAGSVTLALTASQTLEPDNSKLADRVTRHSIDNATVTALSYEPMVLSTLASNMSYYENTGGVPVLKSIPGVRDILNGIAPLKEGKRRKGVYQSSVIILEPVVIPTIEDLVRFHGGWRAASSAGMSGSLSQDKGGKNQSG